MTRNLTTTHMNNAREYKKTATIKDVQVGTEFVVDTLEGTFIGKPGDWLAEGIEGERYIIDDAIFRNTCEEVL